MKCIVCLEWNVETFRVAPHHLERLSRELPGADFVRVNGEAEFLRELPGADAAVVWNFKREWYELAPKLRAVFTPAAGRDWVEDDPSGRVRTFHGSFHGRVMGETLAAMILYFNRRLDAAVRSSAAGVWDRTPFAGTSSLSALHVALVGYGAIGRHAARMLKPFGCRITGVKRSPEKGEKGAADEVIAFGRLAEILPSVDHLALILPAEAAGVFGREHFDAMKRGAYLYNVGRGACYDERELVRALDEGAIAGAGLDVFGTEPLPASSPLWRRDNVLVLPHASAMAREYLDFYLDELIPELKGMG